MTWHELYEELESANDAVPIQIVPPSYLLEAPEGQASRALAAAERELGARLQTAVAEYSRTRQWPLQRDTGNHLLRRRIAFAKLVVKAMMQSGSSAKSPEAPETPTGATLPQLFQWLLVDAWASAGLPDALRRRRLQEGHPPPSKPEAPGGSRF